MRQGRLGFAAVVVALGPVGCSSPARAPQATATAHPRVLASAPDRTAAVTALLALRSQAVLHHDAAAYLATDDPGAAPEFLHREQSAASVLAGLRFDSWQLALEPGPDLAAAEALQRSHGVDAAWLPATRLTYRLTGGDGTPTTSRLTLTFVLRHGRWLVGGDSDVSGGNREAWDFGPLQELRGQSSLVLAHPGEPAEDRELVADADAAVPVVAAAWGQDWPRRVLLVVPASSAEFEAVARAKVDLSDDAAVESAEVGGDGAGTRVVVNRSVLFSRTSQIARQIVITHEVTHVATAAATGSRTPTWLIEGFADDVAFGATHLAPAEVTPALAAAVRAGRIPTELPTDADFAGTGGALDLAYGEAWFACHTVVALAGMRSLVRLYRLVGSGTAWQQALQQVTGRDLASFTLTWRGAMLADFA